MSKFDYRRPQKTADRLLDRFGFAAILRRAGTVAPSTPWEATSGSPTDYPIKALFSEYTDGERDGTLIQQGDRRIVFSAKGLAAIPKTADMIVIGDTDPWNIVNVATVAPGNIPIIYAAQVRR